MFWNSGVVAVCSSGEDSHGVKVKAKQATVAPPATAPLNSKKPRVDTPIPDTSHLARSPIVPSAATGPGALLVDDDRQKFLAALRGAVTTATSEELAGTGWTGEQCPYIEYWFTYYEHRSARDIEAALLKYAPMARAATTADDYIRAATHRVRAAAAHWRATSRIDAPAIDVPDPTATLAELGPGEPLDSATRTRFESAMGTNLSQTRVHRDARGETAAAEAHARAFAIGDHIAFGANEYSPGTVDGDALLAHELAHTQQQDSASATTAGAAHEQNADRNAVGWIGRLWGGLTSFARAPRATTSLQLQRCSNKKLPDVSAGAVPNYDSFSNAAGESARTNEQAAAWAAMFQNPDQLDRVFADAAGGDARAREVVAELHTFFSEAGKEIAEIENRPDCLIPAWRELKGAITTGCMVNWSGLRFLDGSRPGGEALREDVAKAYSARSRELGIRNSIIVNALTAFMVGWEAKAALAEESSALLAHGEPAPPKAEPTFVDDEASLPKREPVDEAGTTAKSASPPTMHEGKEVVAESDGPRSQVRNMMSSRPKNRPGHPAFGCAARAATSSSRASARSVQSCPRRLRTRRRGFASTR